MRARIYVNDALVGEVSVEDAGASGKQREIAPADLVTVAFIDDGEPTNQRKRPLFLRGRVETA